MLRTRAIVWLALGSSVACGGERDPAGEDFGYSAEPVALTPAEREVREQRAQIEAFLPATGNRGLVVNNCATCHSPLCATLGQRTPEEWAAVERSHEFYIPGLSKEDHGKIFDYLKRHFHDGAPEPQIPAHLLPGGCPTLDR